MQPKNHHITLDNSRGVTWRRGVSKAADELGVDRSHLYRVLKGQRESKTLLGKVAQFYPELLAECKY